MNHLTPNNALQRTLDCSLRLATPSLNPPSTAPELECWAAYQGGPNVEGADTTGHPKRTAVHITFWAGHLSLLASLGLDPSLVATSLLAIGFFTSVGFCIAIGLYLSRLGYSGAIWGVLCLVSLPAGSIVGYIASFLVSPKV